VRFVFIEAEKAQYPIGVLCDVLQVSRSGFYAWRRRGPSARATADERLAVEIAAVHKRTSGRYGSPRVHRELRAKGRRVSKKRVERVMRERGIRGKMKRRFRRTTDSNHTSPIAPNIVARQFEPSAQNQVLRVSGTLIPGSLQRESDGLSVQFLIADAAAAAPLTVTYRGGQVPDTMADASAGDVEIVAEGKLNSAGTFAATDVLAKCPSRLEDATPTTRDYADGTT